MQVTWRFFSQNKTYPPSDSAKQLVGWHIDYLMDGHIKEYNILLCSLVRSTQKNVNLSSLTVHWRGNMMLNSD